MRALALATMTAAFAVSVAGKFAFGSCLSGVPQWTYDDYKLGLTDRTPYYHYLQGMDRDFFYTYELLESLGFKFQGDIFCDDLATIAPWKDLALEQYDAAMAKDKTQTAVDK